jgi:phosphatidylserine/phosphatidylglycerophosphate/cardiolipin synthase-like enzyme
MKKMKLAIQVWILLILATLSFGGVAHAATVCSKAHSPGETSARSASERNEEAAYRELAERNAKKYPELSFALSDPKVFIAKMRERFEQQKKITPEDPRLFDFKEMGQPIVSFMSKELIDYNQKLMDMEATLKATKPGFFGRRKHRSALMDVVTAQKYVKELRDEMEVMNSTGVYPYLKVVEVGYFYGRIRGIFQFKELSLYQKSTIWIDMLANGFRKKSVSEEYEMYKRRSSPIIQVRSQFAGQFRAAEIPFEKAFNNKQELEFVIIPSNGEFDRHIFQRLMPREIHFFGVTHEPILADGFNRPGALFWMHDVRHEAVKYMKMKKYRDENRLTKEQVEQMNLLSEQWHLQLEKKISEIPDSELREAVDLFYFNFHHDLGNPLIPSVYLAPKGMFTITSLYYQMKGAGQFLGFNNPTTMLPKADAWLKDFWQKELEKEKQVLNPNRLRSESTDREGRPQGQNLFELKQDNVRQFAFGTPWRNVPLADLQLLVKPSDALRVRVEALSGEKMPEKAFEDKDIHYRPSFQNAPRLKSLMVFALNARLDFSTGLIFDAIKYHAAQGTQVVVVLSRLNQLVFSVPGSANAEAKMQADMLQSIQAAGPNVKVVFWGESGNTHSSDPSLLHIGAAMHAKALVGVGVNPKDSFYIGGGRNLADNYYLQVPSDNSTRPEYAQYKNGFYSVSDLDVAVRNHSFSLDVSRHLINLFSVEQRKRLVEMNPHFEPRLLTKQEPNLQVEDTTLALRHFISRPRVDGGELKRDVLESLRNAKRSIRIVTPYMGHLREIFDAISEAAGRGVKVEIVTNLEIKGDDFAPNFVAAVNRINLREVMKNVQVYGWNYKEPMVHIKILQIDNDYVSVHAFNFNRRSFAGDVENGVQFMGPKASDFIDPIYTHIRDNLSDPVEHLAAVDLMTTTMSILLRPHL